MNNSQLMFSIVLVTALVMLLLGFLLFMLLWQRGKNNRFNSEKEMMRAKFNEQLLRSQLEIQEQSFNVISMEIHDNVGQTLSLLKVQVNIMEQRDLLDKSLLGDIKENVGKAMADLRDIANSLSTERIQTSSLSKMTAHELRRIRNIGVQKVDLEVVGEEREIKIDKKLILFRIIQEGLQNIIKHSTALNVLIRFTFGRELLTIVISDDGKGFDPALLYTGEGGLGLKNIVSRAAIIAGAATIDSMAGAGTTITISVPYE
jgi:two-component system NarL family sensor kinase